MTKTRIETLTILHQPPRILFGWKRYKKKFGGRWNGWGGGVEDGETIEEARKREDYGESKVNLIYIEKKGIILFKFLGSNEPDHKVHIHKAGDYEGVLRPSGDFLGYACFHEDRPPFDNMMPGDEYWIPHLVNGSYFRGEIHFKKDDNGKLKVVYHEINKVDSLD